MPFNSPYGNGPKDLNPAVPSNPYMGLSAEPAPAAPKASKGASNPYMATNPYMNPSEAAGGDSGASDENVPEEGMGTSIAKGIGIDPTGARGGVTQQIKDLWQRAKASFGSNPDQAAQILGKYYGDANVRVSDGQVEFRRDPKSEFIKMDPDHMEILGDVIADMIGPAFEGAVAGGTEGAAAFGGGPVGAVGGIAAAGMAGAAARRSVVSGMGVDPNSGGASFTGDATQAAAGVVAGKAIVGVGNWVKSQVLQAVEEAPMNRLMAIARLRKATEDTIIQSGPTAVTSRQVGQNVVQALDHVQGRYEAGVSLANNRAIQLSKDRIIPMPQTVSKMREIIQREGGEILPSGEAVLPSLPGEDGTIMASKPFGDPNGRAALSKLVDDHNLITRNQQNPGLTMRELINNVKAYQKLSKFDEANPFSPETLNGYREIQQAMGGGSFDKGQRILGDRDAAFQKLFADQPERPLLEKAYQDYSNHIEPIQAFQDAFRQAKSPEAFADALITKGGSQGVRDLKYVLGEHSDEFKQVKSVWINKMFNDSIEPKTGIFRAQNFVNELDSHGKDVLNELLAPGDLNKLKLIAAKANRIYTADFNSTGTQAAAKDLVTFLSGSPGKVAARTLFKLTGKNMKAQDYLLDRGFIEAAAQAEDTPMKLQIIEAMSDYENMVKPTRRVGKTGKMLRGVVGVSAADAVSSNLNQE
jgi:hypothetical protein